MSRLAEYMADLATLLGETGNVHFLCVEEGSTKLAYVVEEEAILKVDERVTLVRSGEGPADAIRAFGTINRRLREDNGTGEITERGSGAKIIKFPGRDAVEEKTYGHVTQQGSLDGEVIRVGGTKDIVSVHLQSGRSQYHCTASRGVAKALAEHLFTGQVRVFGVGRWLRSEAGHWSVERFQVQRFEALDDRPLSAVLADLRAIPGADWRDAPDLWGELDILRNGPREIN
jgi:hypothetical protein